LLKEGKKESNIFVTGNTAIDALHTTVKTDYEHELLDWARNSRLIMLTVHRRENMGKPLIDIFNAIRKILIKHPDVKIVYPVHKNPVIRAAAKEIFNNIENIRLVEPLNVLDFHNIIARAYLILTDSGGIQEEAPSLGIPVLVARNTTERPEGIEAGTLKLVGTNTNEIYKNIELLLEDEKEYKKMSNASNPYGNGTACILIADLLENIILR
jgi:UDP-N-acetylglucosamine 2-epimerase (non-hydrolysing)